MELLDRDRQQQIVYIAFQVKYTNECLISFDCNISSYKDVGNFLNSKHVALRAYLIH